MADHGLLDDQRTLRFTRILPGPIDRVWSYLTEAEHRAKWLADGETGKAVGAVIEFRFNHDNLTPHEETSPSGSCGDEGAGFEGKIEAYDPPHHLAFTWPEQSGGSTHVDIRLTEMEDGKVMLDLSHRGILKRGDLLGASAGWHVHLDILGAKLTEQIPAPFWSSHAKAEGEYSERFANRLSEFVE